MQLAVVEFARHVAGLAEATSQEFAAEDEQATVQPDLSSARSWVIHLMANQKNVTDKGGTMRLGGWDCVLSDHTFARAAYGSKQVRERHRHRYEFNNDFRTSLTAAGLVISGTTPDGNLVEIVEIKDHPWFVGVQYHAEFTSRPISGHPLFNAFIAAAIKNTSLAVRS